MSLEPKSSHANGAPTFARPRAGNYAFSTRASRVVPPVSDDSPIDASFAQRHPLRLLVAEDNVINAKVIALILGKLGYRHDLAKNGAEAVAATRVTTYDVIIMDLQMPEMDGLEATRTILAEHTEAQAPYIMALTANAHTTDCRQCREAGMRDYMTKPAYPAAVAQALQRAHHTLALATV